MAVRRVQDRDGRAGRPRRLEIDIAAGPEWTKRLSITDVDEASLRAIADRFRVLVERSRVTVNGRDLQATISIGGAIAEVGDTAETLFERADAALYRAKEGGRNRVVLAGDRGRLRGKRAQGFGRAARRPQRRRRRAGPRVSQSTITPTTHAMNRSIQ